MRKSIMKPVFEIVIDPTRFQDLLGCHLCILEIRRARIQLLMCKEDK